MSNILLVSEIGKRIKARRESIGMSQNDIAQAADISLRSLSALESIGDEKKGKTKAKNINPTLDTLNRLSVALECDISYLLGFSEYYTQKQEQLVNHVGLSPEAADMLSRLFESSLSDIPALANFSRQYLDLYSALITSYGFRGAVDYYGGKVSKLLETGLTDEEENIFDSIENALDYYAFTIARSLEKFVKDYFSKKEADEHGKRQKDNE